MYLSDSINVVVVLVYFGPTIVRAKGQSSPPSPREAETPFSCTRGFQCGARGNHLTEMYMLFTVALSPYNVTLGLNGLCLALQRRIFWQSICACTPPEEVKSNTSVRARSDGLYIQFISRYKLILYTVFFL